MDGHDIHRLHDFLPHLARRQPHLLDLLPVEERPADDQPLKDWVNSLPQKRLVEINDAWVLETLGSLKQSSPMSNVMLRGCLLLTGEFDLSDAAAVSTGTIPRPGDPRRSEIREALQRATQAGVLIYLPEMERYCIPFPVRLAFDGVDFLEPLERESFSLRLIWRFSSIAREMILAAEAVPAGHWRFANMLAAFEAAVESMESSVCEEPHEWMKYSFDFAAVPEDMVVPLADLGECLGPALAHRQSKAMERLLGAAAAASRSARDDAREAGLLMLLGRYQLGVDRFDAAVAAYQRCEFLRIRTRDHEGAVVAISAIALARRESGNAAAAAQEFSRACTFAREHGLSSQEFDTANCAARLLLELGRPADVIAIAEVVTDPKRQHRRRYPASAELIAYHGAALRLAARFRESRERLFFALALAKDFGYRAGEALASLEIAELFEHLREREESVRWIRRAKNLYIQVADYEGLTHCYLAFARAGGDTLGERDLDACLSKALRCAQASHDELLIARVWHERGLLAIDQEFFGTAIGHFTQEAAALRRTARVGTLVDTHLRLADLYLQQESHLAAATEALRAQGIARAFLPDAEPAPVEDALAKTRTHLTPEQFDFLIQEVSDELEAGKLKDV